jgi:hypothetical protein
MMNGRRLADQAHFPAIYRQVWEFYSCTGYSRFVCNLALPDYANYVHGSSPAKDIDPLTTAKGWNPSQRCYQLLKQIQDY